MLRLCEVLVLFEVFHHLSKWPLFLKASEPTLAVEEVELKQDQERH